MAQDLAAMAVTTQSIEVNLIKVAEIGLASDDAPILAPFLGDKKIVIDLTPSADDWLQVTGANAETIAHYEGEAVQSLCMGVTLPMADAEHLELIDNAIRRKAGHSVVTTRTVWKSMNMGEGMMILNLVLDKTSAAPTQLAFITADGIKEGTGRAFLEQCRGDTPWQNFKCAAKVLLEFIHTTPDYMAVVCRPLSVIFAVPPKPLVVLHTAEEKDARIRSAKRFRYML